MKEACSRVPEVSEGPVRIKERARPEQLLEPPQSGWRVMLQRSAVGWKVKQARGRRDARSRRQQVQRRKHE